MYTCYWLAYIDTVISKTGTTRDTDLPGGKKVGWLRLVESSTSILGEGGSFERDLNFKYRSHKKSNTILIEKYQDRINNLRPRRFVLNQYNVKYRIPERKTSEKSRG